MEENTEIPDPPNYDNEEDALKNLNSNSYSLSY